MMLIRPHVLLLLIVSTWLSFGCSSTRSSPDGGDSRVYTFTHDGRSYDIYSLDTPTITPMNVLLRRAEGQVVLRARDDDQDGVLDTLLVGDLSLEAANTIYRAGIAQAMARGQLAQRLPAEVYRAVYEGGYYTVQTFRPDPDRVYNAFIVYDAVLQESAVLLDVNADGVLDTVQRGTITPADAQAAYEAVLRHGVEEGRLLQAEDRVVVQPGSA